MAQRAIEILPAGDGVTFWPVVAGAQAGDPLFAHSGDLVSWRNSTDRDLALRSTGDPDLDRKVAAGGESDLYQVSGSVDYECVKPPQPHRIEVP